MLEGTVKESTDIMDPESPEFKALLATSGSAQKDDKEKEPASSAGAQDKEPSEKVTSKPDDIKLLEKQITGLKAELSRREGNAKRVHELEEQITGLEARVKESQTAVAGTPEEKIKAAVAKFTAEQIIQKRVDWTDELADARAAYREAQHAGDVEASRLAAERLTTARQVLSALETAHAERATRSQSEASAKEKEATALTNEVDTLFTNAYTAFPELKDKESALWKAGDEEFRKMPVLMGKLGAIGELVALSLALAKHPELVKATDAGKVRKDTLKEIEDVAHKALMTGGTGSTTKGTVDYAAMPRDKFEELVTKTKGG